MNVIKSGLVTCLFVSMIMTSAFAQSREKLDAAQFESAADKIENVESNIETNQESKICDADKKAETKTTNEDRFLLRHKYYEFI